jgi:hypothetical protein
VDYIQVKLFFNYRESAFFNFERFRLWKKFENFREAEFFFTTEMEEERDYSLEIIAYREEGTGLN